MTTAKVHLVNIPLIYWEDLAGLRPTGAINKAGPLFCQHGAGEQQVTAGAALTAGALTNRNLSPDIPCPEMNQPETPQFAAGVKHKTRVLKRLCGSENQTVEKSG
jgi:hypothetical protein